MATRKSALWVPKRAEIIFIQFYPANGEQMPGNHPMLVISTKAFKERTRLVVGFPMTHVERHRTTPLIQGSTKSDQRAIWLLMPENLRDLHTQAWDALPAKGAKSCV